MSHAPQLCLLALTLLLLGGCGGPGCGQMAREEAAMAAQRRALLAQQTGDVLRLHLKAREVAAREVALSNAQEDKGCE